MMQVGFYCLESGLVRSKNSINVAIKNFADLCVSSALYWLVGFAVCLGYPTRVCWGLAASYSTTWETPSLPASFCFRLLFCGIAAIIISGAVAERMKFVGYLIVTAVVSTVIYPFFGRWA